MDIKKHWVGKGRKRVLEERGSSDFALPSGNKGRKGD